MYPALKRFFRRLKPVELAVRRLKARLRVRYHRAVRPRRIRAYFAGHAVRKLQLGAGGIWIPGWLNTDLVPVDGRFVYLDATRPFPFPDRSFDCIFSEHQIEHVSYSDGLRMLRECRRVLKPGGRLRISTPDLGVILRLYCPDPDPLERRYIEWSARRFRLEKADAAFVVNNMFRNWGHRFLYDAGTLRAALGEAGFAEVIACRVGESGEESFREVEGHGAVTGEEFNRFESLVLEARRG